MGNTHEASDVSTLHIVDGAIGLLTVFHALVVDVAHDLLQLLINFLSGPVDVTSVLADLLADRKSVV